MEKRIRRQRCQLPSCYYEGYLQKRSIKDKVARKLWTCLCGNTLFFFNEMRDADYIEKLDLSGMISVTDDNSQDHNLDAARFILRIKDRNIKFTAPSAEARELWKGYIYSVAKLFVPSSLNLLPGQVQMLKQTVELEKQRPKNIIPPAVTSCSHYVSVQADMPACYHSVSRVDAELLLEKEAERGNMLLRPGRDGNSFAVTTRQDLYGPVFRHYRVTRKHEGGFFIDVDNPVPCATLHDVINYLVEKTNGVLIPLLIEQTYEDHISYILSDVESGEMSVQQALSIVPPSVPLKPAVLRKPTPEPAPAPTVEESLCLNDMKDTGGPANSSAVPLAPLEKITPKKALMPPTAAPRKISPTPSPRNKNRKMGTHSDTTGQISPATLSELKLKLEQKAKCQD